MILMFIVLYKVFSHDAMAAMFVSLRGGHVGALRGGHVDVSEERPCW